ncbi:HAMP domain-containing histidine kinase [Actinomadura syzygii]|uniref:Signal transduction histidine-protein kinase/phosphatase MprB n=2 Tax=Actinomadura syzygii TaxID=1427538 RepID=A0A5D0TND2_9ACTN|nr:HAMP domain-containing histidine kinase [Actinomadura syzygii]
MGISDRDWGNGGRRETGEVIGGTLSRPSIRVRDTAIAALVAVVVLAVLVTGFDLALRHRERDYLLSDIRVRTQRVTADLRQGTLRKPIPVEPGDPTLIQVVNADRQVVNATSTAAGRPLLSSVVPPPTARLRSFITCSAPVGGCVAIQVVRVTTGPGAMVVYGARPVPALLIGRRLEWVLAGFVVAVSALIAWATWRVVGGTLRPVEQIRARFGEITGSDLSMRVPEPTGEDEIALLARTVNSALERLEQSVRRQRQFTADAAHELRTPLAGLRVSLEELAMSCDSPETTVPVREALTATGRLETLVRDLLFLTRVGADPVDGEPLDLSSLAAAEIRARRTSGRGATGGPPSEIPIQAELSSQVQVLGELGMLSRLLNSLLDNAQRYAATIVTVTLTAQDGDAVLTVADDGPGIPPADRDRVFDRFVRLDTARDREAGGTGLGLAIARDIAALHQGTLQIRDGARGAEFTLRIPLAPHRSDDQEQ